MTSRVLFYLVKTDTEKLERLLFLAQDHFEKKESLLFLAPDEKAAQFLDDFFWKVPETSFLPHRISDKACKDFLVISTRRENFMKAKALFNLWPTPFLQEKVPLIYELEDLTSPLKKNLSQKKFEAYREEKFIIESKGPKYT